MVRSLTTGVGAHQAAPRQPTPRLAIKHGTTSFSTLSFEAQHPGVSPSPRKQTQDHAIATCREGPIVVIVCMLGSSESWEPQQRPLPWRSAPVEEPSTASISDIAASAILGNGLVYLSPREGEHRLLATGTRPVLYVYWIGYV